MILTTSSKLQVEPLVVGPLLSNCYIVYDEKVKEGIIIDPGEDADVILKTVKELGIKIKYILATHGHFDHVGALAPVKRELNVKFFAHKEDFFFIEDGVNGFLVDRDLQAYKDKLNWIKSYPEKAYKFPLKYFSRNICLLVKKVSEG